MLRRELLPAKDGSKGRVISTAQQEYWYARAQGKTRDAQSILKRAHNKGVPVPKLLIL